MTIPTERFDELFKKREQRKQQEAVSLKQAEEKLSLAEKSAKNLFDKFNSRFAETVNYLQKRGFPAHASSDAANLTLQLFVASPDYVSPEDGAQLKGNPKTWALEIKIDPAVQNVTGIQTAQEDRPDRNHSGTLGFLEVLEGGQDFVVGFLDNFTKSV